MNMKLVMILSAMLLLLITACNTTDKPIYENIDATAFRSLINSNNNVFVLDVHIPEQQHIKGTTAVIPYDVIKDNIDKLPADKNTPIAVYCRSGSMSIEASKTLSELGYTKIYNLVGGANSWRTAGYEFQ